MTKQFLPILAALATLALPAGASHRDNDEKKHSTRTLRDSLAPTTPCRLVVDNLYGDITVRGGGSETISVVATETVWAESEAAAARASDEVELEIGYYDGAADVFVDGPFRDPDDRSQWARRHRDPGYTVVYDLEIRVPQDCDLDVRTINQGEVEVSGVRGELEVGNVNGGIRFERVTALGGEVNTVNGSILATFETGPSADLSFTTVNGRIELSFPPDLSADLRLETMWGEMWTEFELEALPALPPTRRQEDGRTVIEVGKGVGLRIGRGGPEIAMKTLNGDLLIRKES